MTEFEKDQIVRYTATVPPGGMTGSVVVPEADSAGRIVVRNQDTGAYEVWNARNTEPHESFEAGHVYRVTHNSDLRKVVIKKGEWALGWRLGGDGEVMPWYASDRNRRDYREVDASRWPEEAQEQGR